MEVGVRELRNNLSRYLEKVQEGEEIVVTERGRTVARVVPLSGERKIDRLIAAGLIQPAPEKKRPASPPRIRAKGTVSDLVTVGESPTSCESNLPGGPSTKKPIGG